MRSNDLGVKGMKDRKKKEETENESSLKRETKKLVGTTMESIS